MIVPGPAHAEAFHLPGRHNQADHAGKRHRVTQMTSWDEVADAMGFADFGEAAQQRRHPERYETDALGTHLKPGEKETRYQVRPASRQGGPLVPVLYDVTPLPAGMKVDEARAKGYAFVDGPGLRPYVIVPGSERPPDHVFRAVSEEDYRRMASGGELNTDARATGAEAEGMVTSVGDPSSYLPTDGDGRILRIRYHPEDGWTADPLDQYVKSGEWSQIPWERVDLVSPTISRQDGKITSVGPDPTRGTMARSAEEFLWTAEVESRMEEELPGVVPALASGFLTAGFMARYRAARRAAAFHLPGRHNQQDHAGRRHRARGTVATDLTGQLVMDVGVDPPTAQRIQRAVERLTDRYGAPINRAEVMPPDVPMSAVAAMDDRGTLFVNPFGLDPVNLRGAVAAGNIAHGEETVDGILTHEYAHRLLKAPGRARFIDDAAADAWEVAERAGFDDRPEAIERDLSVYATVNPSELDAEVFASYHYGGTYRAPWVIAWGEAFDRYFGATEPLSATKTVAAAASPPEPEPPPEQDEDERPWMTPGFVIPTPERPDDDEAATPAGFAVAFHPGHANQKVHGHRGRRWAPSGMPLGSQHPGGKTPADPEAVEAHFQGMLDRAAERGTLARDAAWYADAHDAVGEWAAGKDVPPQTFAAMVAATSPQMAWETSHGRKLNLEAAARAVDVARAYPEATGEQAARAVAAPGMLRRSLADAVDLYHGAKPDDVLHGPKVRSFYNNLAWVDGTADVTIDTWMVRAAAGRELSKTEVGPYTRGAAYGWTADRVRAVAKRNHLSPAAAQAVIWSQARQAVAA